MDLARIQLTDRDYIYIEHLSDGRAWDVTPRRSRGTGLADLVAVARGNYAERPMENGMPDGGHWTIATFSENENAGDAEIRVQYALLSPIAEAYMGLIPWHEAVELDLMGREPSASGPAQGIVR